MTFLTKLIAVPVRALAKLFCLIPIFDDIPLWSASWRLSFSPDDACKLLSVVSAKKGTDAARRMAARVVEKTKTSGPAAIMAGIEFVNGNFDDAHYWVKLAEDNKYKNPEQLLLVKLLLSDYLPEYEKNKIADRILSRNDLPMTVTHLALISKAFISLEKNNNTQAEKIADQLLSVIEDPYARIIKWAVCAAAGKNALANTHLSKAQKILPPKTLNPLVAQACLCIGDDDAAMEWLYQAGELDYKIAASDSPVGRLSRSQKFRDFRRERQNL